MLQAGSTFGPYQILSVLGEGGMGIVYEAMDNRLDRTVALKLIRQELAQDTDFRTRLADEAKRAAKINSPFVVKVWEHGTTDNQPYIALEFIPGPTLRDAAAELDFRQKVNIAEQIAMGLQSAHAENLVHRDLKPENIKLTKDNEVRILDFGLAKVVTSNAVDAQGNIEGTLHYLSPEQVASEPLTGSSDIFAYGIVLYELFTGIRPFDGPYPAAIIYSILHEDPASPKAIDDSIPDWLEQVILKALAKRPEDRQASMAAVLDAFAAIKGAGPSYSSEPPVKPKKSVTVVDIKNLSGDPKLDYFCEGFTDDVINELSRRTDLVVSAEPSTSLQRNVKEMFQKLHSDYLLVGSLLFWQEQVKLNLTVYGDAGDRIVASHKYEEQATALFELLSKAAKDVAESLAKETGFSSIEVEDYLKTDISAYDYYLKGKAYYATNRPEDLAFAENMYKKALEIDPRLAVAFAGLADVYCFQYMAYYDRSHARIEAARTQAKHAIAIAPTLPEAHRSLGRVYMFTGDLASAEDSFRAAIEHNPKFAIGYRTMAWLKAGQGILDDAVTWAKKSLELAPTDLETLLLLGMLNLDQRKYTVAMATLQRAIELGPDYGRAYHLLGVVYLKLGVLDLALENFLFAVRYKGDPNSSIDAGYIYLVQRNYDKARFYFNESIAANHLLFVARYYLGYLELIQGNQAEAAKQFAQSQQDGRQQESAESPNHHIQAFRALTYAATGDIPAATEIVDLVEQDVRIDGEVMHNLARTRALCGDYAGARVLLERAYAAPAGPTEKEVRVDPHFAAMMAVSEVS
ncbi:MAG: protein kinase [candidate division Zixibacteria bacterium]|nr:protein kinase [candidate division Zixibacteria bacterium]